MKMDTTICAKLHHLAAHLRAGAPPAEVAAVIDQLAARNLVAGLHEEARRDEAERVGNAAVTAHLFGRAR